MLREITHRLGELARTLGPMRQQLLSQSRLPTKFKLSVAMATAFARGAHNAST